MPNYTDVLMAEHTAENTDLRKRIRGGVPPLTTANGRSRVSAMQRNQLAAAGFAAFLFVGGAAVGALGHRYYAATTVIAPRRSCPPSICSGDAGSPEVDACASDAA